MGEAGSFRVSLAVAGASQVLGPSLRTPPTPHPPSPPPPSWEFCFSQTPPLCVPLPSSPQGDQVTKEMRLFGIQGTSHIPREPLLLCLTCDCSLNQGWSTVDNRN